MVPLSATNVSVADPRMQDDPVYVPLEKLDDELRVIHQGYQDRAHESGFQEDPPSRLLVRIWGQGRVRIVDRHEAVARGIAWVETLGTEPQPTKGAKNGSVYWPLELFYNHKRLVHCQHQQFTDHMGAPEVPARRLLIRVSGVGRVRIIDRMEARVLGIVWCENLLKA